jgi:hypothetical protein
VKTFALVVMQVFARHYQVIRLPVHLK